MSNGVSIQEIQVIPQTISVNPGSVVGGSGNFSVTITVDQTGGSIQVDTDHETLLNSPSGSWPYQPNIPSSGPASTSFTLTTNSVTAILFVKIYSCEDGVDITNPSNWRVVATVVMTP